MATKEEKIERNLPKGWKLLRDSQNEVVPDCYIDIGNRIAVSSQYGASDGAFFKFFSGLAQGKSTLFEKLVDVQVSARWNQALSLNGSRGFYVIEYSSLEDNLNKQVEDLLIAKIKETIGNQEQTISGLNTGSRGNVGFVR